MCGMNAINRACELVGGVGKLAVLAGVAVPTASQWCNGKRQVPAERCIVIERASKGVIRCEDLRPDVEWGVLRQAPLSEAANQAQQPTAQGV